MPDKGDPESNRGVHALMQNCDSESENQGCANGLCCGIITEVKGGSSVGWDSLTQSEKL